MNNIGFSDLRTHRPWMDFRACDVGLDPYEMTVYVQICRRASGSNEAFLSAESFAQACGMSRRKVFDVFDSLIKRNMIAIVDNPAHCTDRRRRVYAPTSTSSWQKTDVKEQEKNSAPHALSAPRALIDPEQCTTCTELSAPHALIQVSLDEKNKERRIPPKGGSERAFARRTPPVSKERSPGSQVWDEYRAGMLARWRTDPPRNVKTASQCKKLIELVGFDNAMALAKAYPERVDKWYTENGHPFGLLLTDYPKLLRDLSLGFKITHDMAKRLESTFDGVQAMTLADQGIMGCPIESFSDRTVEALPEHDDCLF